MSTTLIGALSQRLMRKVCKQCAKRVAFNPAHLIQEHAENLFGAGRVPTAPFEVLEQGSGCERCAGGNAGRTVVAEVMLMEKGVRELVYSRASNAQVVKAARETGFRTMMDNALWLMVKGEATLKEIEATVGPMTVSKAKRGERGASGGMP